MQDKKKYKEQPDDFSNRIGKKLENHRMPVDKDCWNEIELQMKPKKRSMIWWVASSVAAVAAIILLFLFQPSTHTTIETTITQEIKKTSDEKVNKEQTNGNIIIKKPIENIRLISQKARRTVSSNKNSLVNEPNPIKNSPVTNDTVHLATIETYQSDIIIEDEVDTHKSESIPSSPQIKNTVPQKKESPILLPLRKSNNDKWLLAAAVSSGGNISVGNKSYDNAYFTDLASSTPSFIQELSPSTQATQYEKNMLSPSDFSNIEHSLPLSFGITVRKNLSKRIGVETGLMYTYLSSKFEKQGNPSYQAKQELHYLGVPINMVFYIWDNPKWNIYISAGGMAEKGLRRNYSQNMHSYDGTTSTLFEKESVSGIQWSLNASVGISYKLHQNWGLYFEPRYSYFYNNNQPISIRTENPRVFGLNGGFRYEF